MTKAIKISDVHYQMLVDVGKRWRMKPDNLVGELIQEAYSSKSKKKWKEHQIEESQGPPEATKSESNNESIFSKKTAPEFWGGKGQQSGQSSM